MSQLGTENSSLWIISRQLSTVEMGCEPKAGFLESSKTLPLLARNAKVSEKMLRL